MDSEVQSADRGFQSDRKAFSHLPASALRPTRISSGVVGLVAALFANQAQALCPLPYALTNGSAADATQVMANLNALATCIPAGAGDYLKIGEVVTSSSQNSVTFSSIPQTFRDLEIRVRGRGTQASTSVIVRMQLNGDTAANYITERENRWGAVGSASSTYFELMPMSGSTGAPANVPSDGKATLYDYRGTTFFKGIHALSWIMDGTASPGNVGNQANEGAWKSTSAITSVLIYLSAGAFVDGTVVSLYGVN